MTTAPHISATQKNSENVQFSTTCPADQGTLHPAHILSHEHRANPAPTLGTITCRLLPASGPLSWRHRALPAHDHLTSTTRAQA